MYIIDKIMCFSLKFKFLQTVLLIFCNQKLFLFYKTDNIHYLSMILIIFIHIIILSSIFIYQYYCYLSFLLFILTYIYNILSDAIISHNTDSSLSIVYILPAGLR